MNEAKVNFLKTDLIFHLKHLAPDASGTWGRMKGQQMVEHLSEMIQLASGKKSFKGALDEEKIKKGYLFLMSDKPFRENTINPLLPEAPKPVAHNTMQQAIEELQQELNYFFEHYKNNPGLKVHNPIFGDLNFEEQVQLLHKHTQHHLKQFGLIS